MNEVFEKNVRALRESRPNLYSELEDQIKLAQEHPEGHNGTRYKIENKQLPFPNLRIQSNRGEFRYHAEDPIQEAMQVFEKAKLDHPQMVFFFGPGLGYMPAQFYNNRPANNSFIGILEKDPQVFLRSLGIQDYSRLFSDEDVHFFIGVTPAKFQADTVQLFQKYLTVSSFLKVLGTPAELEFNGEYYGEAARLLVQSRDRSVIASGNSIQDSFIGYCNTIGNIEQGVKSHGLAPLLGQFKGKTILSVAAGPDLERHWDAIKELQGKIPIVVCDTLLRTMIDKGIEPDFVTAIERVPIVATFFDGVRIPERSSLVGPLLLLPETFEKFKGRHLVYCPTVQNGHALGFSYLHSFFPGSSAGNLNVTLACLLGFQNIIMIGHNLAYGLSGMSHVKGTGIKKQDDVVPEEEIKRKSAGRKFVTQDGQDEVSTTIWWEQFLHQMEDTIGRYPDRRFINTAPKGARIRGAEFMELSDALADIQPEDFDLFPELQKILPPLSDEEISERRELSVSKLKIHKERMQYWLEKTDELVKDIGRWKKKILDRETEGKRVSLSFLDERLDTVLKVKVEAVNKDIDFHEGAMSTMLPGHMALERELNKMPGTYSDNYLLKRDFLLRHEHYFKVWQHWLPQMIDEIDKYFESHSEKPKAN